MGIRNFFVLASVVLLFSGCGHLEKEVQVKHRKELKNDTEVLGIRKLLRSNFILNNKCESKITKLLEKYNQQRAEFFSLQKELWSLKVRDSLTLNEKRKIESLEKKSVLMESELKEILKEYLKVRLEMIGFLQERFLMLRKLEEMNVNDCWEKEELAGIKENMKKRIAYLEEKVFLGIEQDMRVLHAEVCALEEKKKNGGIVDESDLRKKKDERQRLRRQLDVQKEKIDGIYELGKWPRSQTMLPFESIGESQWKAE